MHIFVFLHRFLENEFFRIPQPARAALILQKLISSKNLKVFQKTAINQRLLKKSFAFSLLEIIIATSLFAIILGTTSTLFFRYQKLAAKMESLRPKVMERTLFYEKFFTMAPNIEHSTLEEDHTTYKNLLKFSYDNGWRQNPGVGGHCTCRLYRDENQCLIYHITNIKGQEAKRVFLRDISYFKAKWDKKHLKLYFKNLEGKDFSYTFQLYKQDKGEK